MIRFITKKENANKKMRYLKLQNKSKLTTLRT